MPTKGPSPFRRALGRAARHFARRAGHALARMGLQFSAALYSVFALAFGAEGWKNWRADHRQVELAHHAANLTQTRPRTEIELGLALVFTYFAISSWLRALRHGMMGAGPADVQAGAPPRQGQV